MGTKDIYCIGSKLYFLPVKTRVPLKFGLETLTSVTCARVEMTVRNNNGETAKGWGETPLSVQWAWPSKLSYEERHETMKEFCGLLAEKWVKFTVKGHPMEIGYLFLKYQLPLILKTINQKRKEKEDMPLLAALICCSAFDIALHDAYGKLLNIPVYNTYNKEYMNNDLSYFISPAENSNVSFKGKYPEDFLVKTPVSELTAWHLVGGKDLLFENELNGNEPDDGYPILLRDWIKKDGLKCLKVKLRGNDSDWDYNRLIQVGEIANGYKVKWLTSDFNCTVKNPKYVVDILDKLLIEYPQIYSKILYVEQPFTYDIKKYKIDVHSVSARKPLFMDESAHNWSFVKIGRQLGWTGVALKTCKTQTGALLSLSWAKAHGMTLMVQDLTNPMLAQIPHVLLAANAGTIMGVETNAMQFYPEASKLEAKVHPGIYRRSNGKINLQTISGPGFGYHLNEIKRKLPEPSAAFGIV